MVIHIKCNILTRPFLFSSLLNVSSLKFQIQLQFPHTYHTPGADPENFQTGVATEVIAYLCPKGGVDPPPPFMTRLQWFVTNIQTGRVWGCYNAMIPSLCIDCNLFNRIKMFQTLYWHPCSEGNTESSVNWKCLKCICLKSIR